MSLSNTLHLMEQKEKIIKGHIPNVQKFKAVLAFLRAEFTSEAISSKKVFSYPTLFRKNSIIRLKVRLKMPC